MSTKAITPQNLAASATEFAPLFSTTDKANWNTLCKLIGNQLKTEYANGNKYRVFVLNSNTGVNDGESIYFPVEAKNTDDGIKDKEAVNSRAELAMAQLQDKDDVDDRLPRASGAARGSSSTGKFSVYGTCGITGIYGTTDYILKISISPSIPNEA